MATSSSGAMLDTRSAILEKLCERETVWNQYISLTYNTDLSELVSEDQFLSLSIRVRQEYEGYYTLLNKASIYLIGMQEILA